ncbi:MAG: TonB family protein [Candidatus Acidoferrum typicum]|nr:TonB family protein [Candidatus Acidoferrum typicum]
MKNLTTTAALCGAYFRWEPPDEAVSIDLHLNIVQLLERDVVRAGENSAAGLLLGRMEAGHLIVEGAEAATPETGAPKSPFTDLAKMEPMLDRWRPGKKRISIVGLYRSSGQGGSVLTKDDLAVLRACIGATDVTVANANPQSTESEHITSETNSEGSLQLFLLIEPCENRAANATIYLTRSCAVLHELSLAPFNRAELSKHQPAEETNTPCTPLLRHEVKTDFQERNPLPPERIQYKAAMKWRWLVAPAGIAILGGLLVLGNRQQLHFLSDPQRSAEHHLGLKLQRSGNDWELRWDQDASILLTGAAGHLRISDGAIHKELDLTTSELRNGRIIYTPMTDDVAMELEVESPKSAKPFSESVRIVAGMLPAQGSQGAIATRIHDFPTQNSLTSSKPISTAPSTIGVSSEQARPLNPTPAPHTRPSTSTPLATQKISLGRKNQNDHTNAEGEGERSNEPSLSFSERTAFLDSPKMLVPLSSPPAPLGGKIEPAQLISRSDPIYPQLAKRQQIAGTVEVNFKISANGEVRDVTAKGPSVLTQAAIEAVQKWRYVPARLNGVSTETKATTVVAFRLN